MNGTCLCLPGYGGADCEQRLCNPPCGPHEMCETSVTLDAAVCFCVPPYSGDHCAVMGTAAASLWYAFGVGGLLGLLVIVPGLAMLQGACSSAVHRHAQRLLGVVNERPRRQVPGALLDGYQRL